ncbi:MAG TPA: calcium/proton exchanger [Vicinamibacterales bacterium]|nr:calcium/proton exchanger [Vicinamibacterales bacterium]
MPTAATQLLRIVTGSWLNLLLIVAPLSLWLRWQRGVSIWVFFTAALALVPAAGLIGAATEHLARRSGPTLGGFLNATFGNAAELIIAIVALRANHTEIVKASITGSIIGNLLLVFGLSCLVGGIKNGRQKFNKLSAGSATVMLYLATVALVMPALLALISFGSLEAHPAVIDKLSFWSSIVLLGVYAAGLVFAFRSQSDPLRADPGHTQGAILGVAPAMTLLVAATAFTAIEAEVLIEALEPALGGLGMSELFAGVIVVALVGNAAEHYSAVTAASDNEMTLAFEISVGSSAQIALMVAPALVLLSFALGSPMSLVFNAFEISAIGLSVIGVTLVASDGESNWLEGLQLLGLYGIFAIAFYLIPTK